MFFTIYKQDGQIINAGYCIASDFEIQQVPKGCQILPIQSNPSTQYIENNIAVDMPEKPNQWSVFNYSTKTWDSNFEAADTIQKGKRQSLLTNSDWTQIPNNPLTEQKQQEWAVYRQQLRDITSQSGYPFNVVWPTEPR
jgi:hypothetical protein